MLLPKEPLPVARHILDSWPMESITTPDLDFFLDEEPVEIVPFQKSFEQVKDEPFCILHTSGSTGIPKPVPVTYGSYGSMDAQHLIPSLGHKPTFLNHVQGKRIFFALPVFYAASLNWTLGVALFAGVTVVLPPPAPLTADLTSRICQRIRLMTLMGSCETSLLPHEMLDDPQDWEYIPLSPCLGATFQDGREAESVDHGEHHHPGEIVVVNGGVALSDEMALTIEAIVELKVSEALDRLASALQAAAGPLRSSDGATSVLAVASQGRNAPAIEKVGKNGTVQPKENGHGSKSAEARLRHIIYGTLAENLDVGGLKDDTDFFQHGLDSLQVVSLLNAINVFIVKSEQSVDPLEREAIYSNPTVAKLVAIIIQPHPIPPSH
ncbi:acetyl-CoA synthetase-like protein [Apiospora sp. TS-2023a]